MPPMPFPKGGRGKRNTPEKFWAGVDVRGPDECWEWTGYQHEGYGRVRYKDLTAAKNIVRAHQVAYCLSNDCPLPPVGKVIHHLCENKLCCNPSHLELLELPEHINHHRGYGCRVHGYLEWRVQPSGQKKCGICNRERTRLLAERKKSAQTSSTSTTSGTDGATIFQASAIWPDS